MESSGRFTSGPLLVSGRLLIVVRIEVNRIAGFEDVTRVDRGEFIGINPQNLGVSLCQFVAPARRVRLLIKDPLGDALCIFANAAFVWPVEIRSLYRSCQDLSRSFKPIYRMSGSFLGRS